MVFWALNMVLGLWHRETSLQWIQIFSWKKQYLKHKIIFLQRDHKDFILAWSVLIHSLLCSVSSFRKCCNSTCQNNLFFRILPKTNSQMLRRVYCNWGPIFKVVLECWKGCSKPFLIYIYGKQYAEKLLKTLKFLKMLNSLYKSGSRPQKSPKKPTKRITQSRFTQIFE